MKNNDIIEIITDNEREKDIDVAQIK